MPKRPTSTDPGFEARYVIETALRRVLNDGDTVTSSNVGTAAAEAAQALQNERLLAEGQDR